MSARDRGRRLGDAGALIGFLGIVRDWPVAARSAGLDEGALQGAREDDRRVRTGLAPLRGLGTLGEPEHRRRQLAGDDVRERDRLEHLADVGPQRQPDVAQRFRGRRGTRSRPRLAAHGRQRALDRADHLRQRDLGPASRASQ